MNSRNLKRVSEKTVKAVKDNTNWDKIYSQTEVEIQENASSDPDAPCLKNVVYKKAVQG
ncbi:hypothetical protein [Vibrio cincinnatiensis]|uniref:hypothetical protein n=1 Tax=Vibrio cincinnatiensis TaxID=675 RepID=UPI001EDDEDBE|nr:hypothetical protein [Vibrio cincinnatiensis]